MKQQMRKTKPKDFTEDQLVKKETLEDFIDWFTSDESESV